MSRKCQGNLKIWKCLGDIRELLFLKLLAIFLAGESQIQFLGNVMGLSMNFFPCNDVFVTIGSILQVNILALMPNRMEFHVILLVLEGNVPAVLMYSINI